MLRFFPTALVCGLVCLLPSNDALMTKYFSIKPSRHKPINIRATSVFNYATQSSSKLNREQSPTVKLLAAASEAAHERDATDNNPQSNNNRVDRILSQCISLFPLFVLSAAILALVSPSTLTWVNQGNIISIMLASVMCGTGLTLETKDFQKVLTDDWKSVPLGVICQFAIMPLAAWTVGQLLLQPAVSSTGSALFLGLCLVGASPGGTASNLVSLIAQADVALSVILTAISTMMAVFMTPLLVKFLVGANIQVSGMALCEATARVVLVPVLGGMVLNAKLPRVARFLSRFTPFASVLLVALICGGVVAQNAALLLGEAGPRALLPAVLLLHALGFAGGYWIPRVVFGRSERSSRTISIEVGMQNSALAVVLARSIGAPPLASLPGALSATAHSCLGSILAAVWRLQASRKEGRGDDSDGEPSDASANMI
ncbi:bile acid:Na+ symporter, BASS family [Fistulifera solaris]|uniref:Bile acid:Na+ symporter, BASS family n=1 Tax=Fistulifera solaris TaxID=1519565 RepID=A0A1Z5JT56_FISSO|nr:bile acid:Na+ symporter, BASS family [Fistulifera solaris]|eukprot:GAX17214.1 bile acid:Na+ symporter, BASS family [Fistulifera solaris]